jgi:MoxR-like ATPase
LEKLLEELGDLKDVLVSKLESSLSALEGGFSAVTGHLWISEDEGKALATALQPKLRKAQDSLSTTLFELVTLELAIERRVDAVVLANLMPRYWADFIRSSSDQEARSMGTVSTV